MSKNSTYLAHQKLDFGIVEIYRTKFRVAIALLRQLSQRLKSYGTQATGRLHTQHLKRLSQRHLLSLYFYASPND